MCARDLDVSLQTLSKVSTSSDGEAESRELERRKRALSRFAGSAYYRTVVGAGRDGDEGESTEDCDAAVAQILDDKEPTPRPT